MIKPYIVNYSEKSMLTGNKTAIESLKVDTTMTENIENDDDNSFSDSPIMSQSNMGVYGYGTERTMAETENDDTNEYNTLITKSIENSDDDDIDDDIYTV